MSAKKQQPESLTAHEKFMAGGLDLPFGAGTVAMQTWMNVGTEVLRFVWDRVQQDMKTQQALLTCTSLEELQRIQTEYFTSMQAQYGAEAGRMLNMISPAAAAGVAPPATARRYDDVPV